MSTSRKRKGFVLILIAGIAVSWGVYECKYYYSQWSDYRNSPWAYSKDENLKLLVGKWVGSFKDPDKVDKTIHLEIFVPLTEEERKNKAGKRWKRASYSSRNKGNFDGVATVNSKLGTEEYKIYGAVDKEDFHKLHFSFRPEDEKKRVLPNFALREVADGKWQGDQLTITMNFSYQKADGSSYSSSDDPRFVATATTTLLRQPH